jgi:hypothetical protein
MCIYSLFAELLIQSEDLHVHKSFCKKYELALSGILNSDVAILREDREAAASSSHSLRVGWQWRGTRRNSTRWNMVRFLFHISIVASVGHLQGGRTGGVGLYHFSMAKKIA